MDSDYDSSYDDLYCTNGKCLIVDVHDYVCPEISNI